MTYTPGAVAEAIGPKGRKIDERASALFSKSASLKRKAENGAPKDEENLAKKVKLPVSKLQKKHKTKLMSSSVSKSKKKPKRLKKSKTEEDDVSEGSSEETETHGDEELKQADVMGGEESEEVDIPAEGEVSDEEISQETKKKVQERDPEVEKRTIFVGNISCESSKKDVKNFFKEFGSIESIRFRSAAPSDPKMPKRAAVIMKDFHEASNSLNGYVIFKDVAAVKKALVKNGEVLNGLHLRVDKLHPSTEKTHDHKRSVFIGNLPLDVREEDLRRHLTKCGDIKNIRLIRDKGTGIGKGFGFVLFEDICAVELAIKMDGEIFKGRKLRIMKSTLDGTQKGSANKASQKSFKSKYEEKLSKRIEVGKQKKKDKKPVTPEQKTAYRVRKARNKKKQKLRQKNKEKQKVAQILTGAKKKK